MTQYRIESKELDGNLQANIDGGFEEWTIESDEACFWDLKYKARDSFRERREYTKSEGFEFHTGCSMEERGKMVFLISVMTPWGCADQNMFFQISVSESK